MSRVLDSYRDIIYDLINTRGYTLQEVRNHLLSITRQTNGLSARYLRRFVITNNLRYRPDNNQLVSEVRRTIGQVGTYYGRRMLTGDLDINSKQTVTKNSIIIIDHSHVYTRAVLGLSRGCHGAVTLIVTGTEKLL